jgi:crossover junction endodeoxyribonuclease RusA
MSKEVKVTLPLPPKQLSPNARVHWAVKAKAVKQYREDARWAVINHCHYHWPAAEVQATFYHSRNARRDKDNLLSSLKAAFDGLVDGGLLSDDSGLTHLPVRTDIDKKNPRVELTIRQL